LTDERLREEIEAIRLLSVIRHQLTMSNHSTSSKNGHDWALLYRVNCRILGAVSALILVVQIGQAYRLHCCKGYIYEKVALGWRNDRNDGRAIIPYTLSSSFSGSDKILLFEELWMTLRSGLAL